MRSRYSAFALGGYGDYLLRSWHPSTVGTLTAESLNASEIAWLGLEIVQHQQQGNSGTVEFKASYATAAGIARVHHERSRFLRVDGRWLYVNGSVEDTELNSGA